MDGRFRVTDTVQPNVNQIVELAVCLLAVLAIAGCERTAATGHSGLGAGEPTPNGSSQPEEAKPLLLAEEPVLLLDDPAPETAGGPVADNSRCFVCHVNYMQEEIAVTHAQVNTGCAACHGASDAHIADESWASGGNGTAPEIIYTRDEINPSCMACHPRERIDTPEHAPVFTGSAERKVCTDCHGNHRLPQRRCKWK